MKIQLSKKKKLRRKLYKWQFPSYMPLSTACSLLFFTMYLNINKAKYKKFKKNNNNQKLFQKVQQKDSTGISPNIRALTKKVTKIIASYFSYRKFSRPSLIS